jgi:nicotinamidase-related amidase
MATNTIERVDPARTALLVMDFQRGLVERVPESEALLTRLRETIELLRGHGATIGYVRVGFADGERPAGRMSRLATPERLASLHADAPGTQIDDRIAPRDGDIVVRKVRVGSFGTTDLHDRLQDRSVDTLLLAGISTSGVVLSTVRDGHDRDYRLIVVSDLVADPEPDVHAFLINRIFPRQADVISSAELPSLLE